MGSKSFLMTPSKSPLDLVQRNVKIKADSVASTLLVFQATLPFLLFAGDGTGTPITFTIQGGTNVSFSLSFEYLDQVLLPTLERFGIFIQRRLESRGWNTGGMDLGAITLKLIPLPPGQTLTAPHWPNERGNLTKIDITILAPRHLQKMLQEILQSWLDRVFPDIEKIMLLVEDSRHPSRIYALLVAHTATGLRFGHDWLYNRKTKDKSADIICREVSKKVVEGLDAELKKGGLVDEYLQDQLVIFQALAQGKTIIPGCAESLASDRTHTDKTHEPFGEGSLHTTTARWVVSQLLPQAQWFDGGRICEGVAWKMVPKHEPECESEQENKPLSA